VKLDADGIRFRLYPENRSLYFHVYVWPDKRSMLKGIRAIRGSAYARKEKVAVAVCSSFNDRKDPCCGEIFCYGNCLDIEIVSHETLHATLGWARRIGLPLKAAGSDGPHVGGEEERFCYAHGQMVSQFVGHLKRRGVWRDKVRRVIRDAGETLPPE